ncbi:hypothetical protein SAMN02949497_2009 [Methylomagnum ishizawai]|uniref:DUF3604 domain-containing protein n=1 Tax=Methylomagnum ishizawai TaxID=1760988 RepID=A0A1Y6D1F8_9GAMM|nr:CehA/McbA family metallohydrolase [Methylomagnum ishizawai]SMF94683.1 hypothetical protein SAMN02949497_2009 [Methylomagnum ishizawai]
MVSSVKQRKPSYLIFLAGWVGLSPLAQAAHTARMLEPTYVVAGQPTAFKYELTVGEQGIPVGGSVVVGFHHASKWQPRLQFGQPTLPAYVKVTGKVANNFKMRFQNVGPTSFAKTADNLYHMVIVATVSKTALVPGEVVTISIGSAQYGGIFQIMADDHHELRIMADTNADGKFEWVASPQFDIIPAPTHHLLMVAPSQVTVGQPFNVQIHAEDAYNNFVNGTYFSTPVPTYNGKVTIIDESEGVLATGVQVTDGWASVPVRVSKPGPHWLRVSDGASGDAGGSGEGGGTSGGNDGTLAGVSNPFKAFAADPEYKIYWGDVHGHTKGSDGLGESQEQYFWYAQKAQHLDMCALSDHGQKMWPQTMAAVRSFYRPGEFVTILGAEASLRGGHVNVYFRGDTAALLPKNWNLMNHVTFIDAVAQQFGTDALMGPHAFSHATTEPYPFSFWNDTVERFVEVYSMHGTNEYPGNARPLAQAIEDPAHFLQGGLVAGRRFGVIASADGHDSHPGRSFGGVYPTGLVAFRAKELTRDAIYDAWRNYQVYATSVERIYLDFSINGSWMGASLTTGDPVQVHYEVIGQDKTFKAELLRNNMVIRTDTTTNGTVAVDFQDTPPDPNNYYYLRVSQANGERAWSTPIWVDKPPAPDAPPAAAKAPRSAKKRARAS